MGTPHLGHKAPKVEGSSFACGGLSPSSPRGRGGRARLGARGRVDGVEGEGWEPSSGSKTAAARSAAADSRNAIY